LAIRHLRLGNRSSGVDAGLSQLCANSSISNYTCTLCPTPVSVSSTPLLLLPAVGHTLPDCRPGQEVESGHSPLLPDLRAPHPLSALDALRTSYQLYPVPPAAGTDADAPCSSPQKVQLRATNRASSPLHCLSSLRENPREHGIRTLPSFHCMCRRLNGHKQSIKAVLKRRRQAPRLMPWSRQ
jgi:hypothetical protein